MNKVDYLSNQVPDYYKCHTCNATNCKLWRDSGAVFMPVKLECVDCSIKSQSNPRVTSYFSKIAASVQVAEDGTYNDTHGRTDQIGWRAPAVPTEDNDSYWGYTSTPQAGVNWWVKLPLRNKK